MKTAAKQFFWYLLALMGAFLIAVLTVPPILDALETVVGRSLSYEVLMRVYLGVMYVLLAWWFRARPWVWGALGILLFVLLSDQKWTLTEENSWIKYPTAGALLLAGYWMRRQSKLLAAGLIFAAADELFSFHEKIGAVIERVLATSHVTTDLVTAAYGLVGLVVVAIVIRRARSFGPWLYLGMLVFVFATALDTLDGVVFGAFRNLTDWLTIHFSFDSVWRFQDLWFALYKPALFMNGLEEVNEFLAAVLFAFAARNAVVARGFIPRLAGGGQAPALRTAPIVAIIILAALTLSRARSFSPIESDLIVTRIATVSDGLFHTDDLDFHPNWGVVVANESAGSRSKTSTAPGVFNLPQNNVTWTTVQDTLFPILQRILDPDNLLVDIDSVHATSSTVYATSGATGRLLAYQAGRRNSSGCAAVSASQAKDPRLPDPCAHAWQSIDLVGRGPKHPEGIASDPSGHLFILDESDASVTEIDPLGKILRRDFPKHALWKAPEGIIYHPGLESFLISDDVTGTIFVYKPAPATVAEDFSLPRGDGNLKVSATLEIFADKVDGLRAPEDLAISKDGDLLVSDNGAREIIVFNQSGERASSIRFRPLWRDLQGVTLDDQGDLYVVTADGYGSSSFVPSVLWRIKGFLSRGS